MTRLKSLMKQQRQSVACFQRLKVILMQLELFDIITNQWPQSSGHCITTAFFSKLSLLWACLTYSFIWEDAVDTMKPAHLTLTRVFSCFPHRMKKFSMAWLYIKLSSWNMRWKVLQKGRAFPFLRLHSYGDKKVYQPASSDNKSS